MYMEAKVWAEVHIVYIAMSHIRERLNSHTGLLNEEFTKEEDGLYRKSEGKSTSCSWQRWLDMRSSDGEQRGLGI